jgi:hypothetical protein
LDGKEEDGAVSFGYHPDATVGGINEDGSEGLLSSGVQMEFRLLKIDELARLGGEESDEDGQGLGDAEAYIGDVDQITVVVQPTNKKLDLCRIDRFGTNMSCKIQEGQVFI